MTEYVHVGAHAEVLQSGRSIGPSDRVSVDELQEGDSYLLEEGHLVDVASFGEGEQLSGDALTQRAAELDIKGRTKMGADELRTAIAAAELTTTEEAPNPTS